ncbi:MAG TPA: IclR family transcriptional regulator [Propionibacteriaceae bacterium]|jgi:DNA-binding IclR family transcriptional regulator
MSEDDQGGRTVVESVLRATRLLGCFRHGEPELTLAELVRRGGYSKTTTYRLLTTLETAEWLERTTQGAFRLTLRPFQIGSILLDSLDLRREAPPVMRRLSEECDQTVYLTIPAGVHAVCIERIDRGQGVRVMDLHVGGSQPLHLGAAPRALLAYHEDDLLPELLRFGLEARTPRSISSAEALRTDLQETRRRGYSISDSDATLGVAALGAAVFDATERAVASISIGGLSEHLLPPRDRTVSLLVGAAAEISARLGSTTPVSHSTLTGGTS